jgi:hypothetical protein
MLSVILPTVLHFRAWLTLNSHSLTYISFYPTYHIAPFHPESPCFTQDSPSITLSYIVSPCLTKFHSVLLKLLHK